MGYMRHHAIIVTSWDGELLRKAHKVAGELFEEISPVLEGYINSYHSFFVPPDGSKEGWEHSDDGDKRRDGLIAWLEGQRDEEQCTALEWVEVQYGDDDLETVVTRDNEELRRLKR